MAGNDRTIAYTYLVSFLIIAAVLGFAVGTCTAAPTTGAVTLIGSNNATVTMTGAATTCWFQWGLQPGSAMTWKTPNQTPAAGVCTATIKGSPLFGNQLWYYRACDVTGCGADATFTTLAVTVLPTPTYGAIFQNLTDNGFDIMLIGMFTVAPFMWIVPTMPGLVWALLVMGLLIGVWLRTRALWYVSLLGLTISLGFFSVAYGLGVDLDWTFVFVGQGILYASFAGLMLSIIKK